MNASLIDLTVQVGSGIAVIEEKRVTLRLPEREYSARVYQYSHGSMAGTYIDFPGHIVETDDGMTAANYPIEKLYRVPAFVLRLDRHAQPGPVTAEDLVSAMPAGEKMPESAAAIVVNALGAKRYDAVPSRSVYFAADAVEWMITRGIHLLVSDIYESNTDPQSVFPRFFRAGVSTVCCPDHLHTLPFRVLLTVLFYRMESVTQVPCRIVAETGKTH